MKFVMPTKQFKSALKAVIPAASTRSTLPVLGGVKIRAAADGVILEATDLEIAARHQLTGLTVEEQGQVVVPAKPLAKAIAAMPGVRVCIEAGDAEPPRVALRADTRTVTLDALAVEDFPVVATDQRSIGSVKASTLSDAFARAAMCASNDEARPVLTSVAVMVTEGSTTLQVVATDSYRMGVIRVELDQPASETRTLLVPARFVKELAKQMRKLRANTSIGLVDGGTESGTKFAVSFDSSTWTSRLVEGEFPNWQQIVPDETGAAVEFEVEEMGSVLKAVQAVGNGSGSPVRISLGETTTLTLSNGNADAIRETLTTATFSPDGVGELEIAFNAKYLADAMRFLGTERARMWVRDGLKPALFGPPDTRYVLMPVRLS